MAEHALSVLAVDDEPEDLSLISSILSREGYPVLPAASGAEAMRILESHRPGLILSDLNLPDMSGLTVLREARRQDPHATGIVLTASNAEDAAVRSLREGAFDFLVKPKAWDLLGPSLDRAASHYRLRRALAQTQEHWSDAVADVSHEIKNPLTVISGYASFLLSKAPEGELPDQVRKGLRAIHENSLHLEGLLQDLTDMCRLSSDRMSLDVAAVPVQEFLSRTADAFSLRAEERGVALVSACVGGPALRAKADHKRLRQIVGNLVGNALKFTPRGGRVNVSAWPEAGAVHFCVQDTGVGISARDRAKVFERHFQAEAGAAAQGMGLGLTISKRLVELHGGRIWIESEEGRGTWVHFTVPATEDAPDPSEFLARPVTAITHRADNGLR
ncbi:MAG TPA: hybrid sensor histidine kinase/response regulator [Elusimicrobiota bacterium]|nr:hybrid sensor histidine kinase/response regulator [Elusimicrobiota bacterium]